MAAKSLIRLAEIFLLGASALILSSCDSGTPAPNTAPEPPAIEAPADLQDEVDVAPDDTSDVPGEPVLWTVSDDDTTVHLFGTVHILKPETEWRTEAFDAVFEASDAVFFEADVTSPEAQATMGELLLQLGVFTDGTKLTDVLDADDEKEVKEAVDLIGVPMSAVEPMKPWLATLQLSVLALEKQGYEANSGVEMVITQAANAAGKPTRYLETGEEQLRIFADFPIEEQVDFLVASAEQIEDEPELLDTLVAEWAEGDIDAIAAIMADPEVMGAQAIYDKLIVDRNDNWTEQITTLMADEPGTFLIAVGAGHLAGEDSVVEMLRADGYEVSGP